MGLFSFKKTKIEQTSTPASTNDSTVMGATSKYASQDTYFDMQVAGHQLTKLNGCYINGPGSLFPNYVNYIRNKSPLHNTILNLKCQLAVSNGYTYDDSRLSMNDKVALNQLLIQFDKILDEIGDNYVGASQVPLKITWNSGHTKILKVTSIPHEKLRISEINDEYEPIEFVYCFDWSNWARFGKVTYPRYNQFDRESDEQIFYFQLKSPNQIIYNRPKWVAAIDWVEQDGLTATYHSANITNSVNPSALIEFFKKAGSPDEEAKILQSINDSFAGARKAGRLMAIFNKDKDTAAKFTSLEPNKLDKTFLVLGDTIQRQICYSHGVDPQILGLKTPGSLGNSLSLPESFKIFNYTQIRPMQKDLECILNTFLSVNGLAVKIKLNTANGLFEDATAKDSAVSDSGSIKNL